MIVGAGVNVQWTAFPPELAEQATVCNLEAGRAVDRTCSSISTSSDSRTASTHSMASPARTARDSRRSEGAVRVEHASGAITGVAVDVRDAGELVVRTDDGEDHVITTADVVHLRST